MLHAKLNCPAATSTNNTVSPPLFVCIRREVRCFWYLRHICSKNSDSQSPVAHYIERLLLDSSLPPQQIAWYVKSLTSEEEQVVTRGRQ